MGTRKVVKRDGGNGNGNGNGQRGGGQQRRGGGQRQQGNGQGGGQLATRDQRVGQIKLIMKNSEREISKALSKQLDPDQFIRACITHYQRGDDRMLKADPRTFVMACVEAAQLGLKPDSALGECYLLPVWSAKSNGYQVDFRIGYQGMMKLARRSGVKIDPPEVVYENDIFEVVLGTDRRIRHVPWYSDGAPEPGDVIAAYATAQLEDGTTTFSVLTRAQIDKRASKSGDPRNNQQSNVWNEWYDAMARKSAARELCKWLPMDDSVRAAMRRDDLLEVARDAAGPAPGAAPEFLDIEIPEERSERTGPPQSLDDLTDDHRRESAEAEGDPDPEEPQDAEREPEGPPEDPE